MLSCNFFVLFLTLYELSQARYSEMENKQYNNIIILYLPVVLRVCIVFCCLTHGLAQISNSEATENKFYPIFT